MTTDLNDRAWEEAVALMNEALRQRDSARAEVRAMTARLDAAQAVIRKCDESLTFGGLLVYFGDEVTPAEAAEIRAATADPTPHTETDT